MASPSRESTPLLEATSPSRLHDLFAPPPVLDPEQPFSNEENNHHLSYRIPIDEAVEGDTSSCDKQCLKDLPNTVVGSVVFMIYHVVFCLAQAATITRPHSSHTSTGELAKMASLGVLLSAPLFIYNVPGVPALYPSSDLFLAPFYFQMAESIDETLYQMQLQDDDTLFLCTFVFMVSMSMLLSGTLCKVAAHHKLANLGQFLPYPVLAGFFATIGLLMYTLGFSIDTGLKIGQVLRSGDWTIIETALLHHVPSLLIGISMHMAGRHHPLWVLFIMMGTIAGSYLMLFVTGTSLAEATVNRWFFSVQDLALSPDTAIQYGPPNPFGGWIGLLRGHVVWEAVWAALSPTIALAFLYLIRCSLHAAAIKKNIPNVTRPGDEHKPKDKSKLSLNYLLEYGYGYSQLVSAFVGAITAAPAVAASLTLFHLGAEKQAPQYGSCLLVALFYFTDFQLVEYIPKPAFSCLMVLAAIDMCRTWIYGSFKKTKDKLEWMVAPVLVILAFSVGMLTAICLGICMATFIFVANFYRAGTVRFVGSGLTLRSMVERGVQATSYLNQHGDLIQILVLQHYIFFGNSQSVVRYVETMFEDDHNGKSTGYVLPPKPKYLVIDFALVSGVDTSAIDSFTDVISLCKKSHCKLYLAGLKHSLRLKLVHAGVKPEGPATSRFSFVEDLDSALAKTEDSLISNEMHIEDMDQSETQNRLRHRRMSNAEDGFLYALTKIDEQHKLQTQSALSDLGRYTVAIELNAGESFVRQGNEGLYFVETGLMRIKASPGFSSAATTMNSSTFLSDSIANDGVIDSTASIGHLDARLNTVAMKAAQWKEQHAQQDIPEQTFRLAKFGQGWIIGGIEEANGMKRPGVYVAVSDCRLHHLSHEAILEVEASNPALAMHLFKVLSLLASKRQESTIQQLSQFVKIMKDPVPRLRGGKKELAQLTLQ